MRFFIRLLWPFGRASTSAEYPSVSGFTIELYPFYAFFARPCVCAHFIHKLFPSYFSNGNVSKAMVLHTVNKSPSAVCMCVCVCTLGWPCNLRRCIYANGNDIQTQRAGMLCTIWLGAYALALYKYCPGWPNRQMLGIRNNSSLFIYLVC